MDESLRFVSPISRQCHKIDVRKMGDHWNVLSDWQPWLTNRYVWNGSWFIIPNRRKMVRRCHCVGEMIVVQCGVEISGTISIQSNNHCHSLQLVKIVFKENKKIRENVCMNSRILSNLNIRRLHFSTYFYPIRQQTTATTLLVNQTLIELQNQSNKWNYIDETVGRW